ncbi:ribulose-phosphate 3-epimerase [Agrococcus lahaulensis]|jgi:ribulose-phosphate 3-epimerase|uniref:ribulose-phosphate 3-epimerase n=1 Tax=Agrococcus TaxID=46352 RepID=UPI000FE3FA91|nr:MULTISPECIES: ribulose-phosphate 3-epimerase [unclassified Agrococcus]MDR7234617.1 ribulose-phosphate 3-epimerase [Agrococcus sp. BE272]RWR23306.1 ribulose-phosphate 3-epimerase [Agrococcus lahaulensis]UOW00507.1 ribulose-phosphate 3-epimerase [Agrococcus sp. SCSIO52902]
MVRIHPSILSADFVNLERDLERIASADGVHLDVMDAHFVPNLTFGLPMVQRIAEVTSLPIDVHLMIDDPDTWALQYAIDGVDSVTFHAEATRDAVALARELRARGARAAIALKPGTAVDDVLEHLREFDMVLVMTVEPGFGGQSFMPEMMPKLQELRGRADELGIELALQVDGGITADTLPIAAAAGADVFVAGSAVYGHADPAERIHALRLAAAPQPGSLDR